MKRRVILIGVIVVALGVIVGGVWFFAARNSSESKMLSRARVALRSNLFPKAIEVADDYIAKYPVTAENPERHKGYLYKSQALSRLGRYEEARKVLEGGIVALAKVGRTEPELTIAISQTYALPARQALNSPDRYKQVDIFDSAIENLTAANKILSGIKTDEARKQLDVRQFLAINLADIGTAEEGRAARLEKDAATAGLAGDKARQATLLKSCQERRAAGVAAHKQASTELLAVVKADLQANPQAVTREVAFDVLANMIVERLARAEADADQESVKFYEDMIRDSLATLRSVSDITKRPPGAAARLYMYEVQASIDQQGLQEAQLRQKIEQIAAELDGLIKGKPEQNGPRVARATLELSLESQEPDVLKKKASLDRAEQYCKEALKIQAGNRDALLTQAVIKIRRAGLAFKLPADQLPAKMTPLEWRNTLLKQAEEELDNLKTKNRNWPDAYYYYALAADQLDHREQAKLAMRKAAEIDPLHGEALSYLARTLRTERMYDSAFTDARAYFRLNQQDPEAITRFVQLAVDTRQSKLAQQELDKVRAEAKKAETTLALSQAYDRLGQRDQGTELARQTLTLEPAAVGLGDQLAVVKALLRLDRYSEAEKRLDTLKKGYPNTAEVHYLMGLVFESAGRNMQAVEAYAKAVDLQDLNLTAREARARALFRAGLIDDCAAEVDRILSRDPANQTALRLKMQSAVLKGEQLSPEQLQQLTGKGREAVIAMAAALVMSGQAEKCAELCEQELAKAPRDEDRQLLVSTLARAYLVMGRKSQGLEQLKVLVNLAPQSQATYRAIAEVLATLTRDELQNSVTLLPPAMKNRKKQELSVMELVEAYLIAVPGGQAEQVDATMAQLYERLGRRNSYLGGGPKKSFTAAAAAYGRIADRTTATTDERDWAALRRVECLALARDPGSADDGRAASTKALAELNKLPLQKSWEARRQIVKAALLVNLGRQAEADAIAKALVEAARQDQSPGAMMAVIAFYGEARQIDQALAVSDQMAVAFPKDVRPRQIRASMLAEQGRLDEAVALQEKVIELQPENLDSYTTLAVMHERRQDLGKVLATLKRMEELGQTARTRASLERGSALMRWGLAAQAIEAFQQVDELGLSNNPTTQLQLAAAFATIGQRELATRQIVGDSKNIGIAKYAKEYLEARLLLVRLTEQPEEQLKLLAQLDADKPGEPAVLAYRMNIMARAGRHAEGLKLYQQAARQAERPLPSEVAALAVQAMIETGDLKSASELSLAMSQRYPEALWRRQSMIMAAYDRPKEALAMLPAKAAEADLFIALLGLCLAETPADVAKWAGRVHELDRQVVGGAGLTPGLHVLLAVIEGQPELAAKELEKFKGSSYQRLVATQMAASAGTPQGAAEAALLLRAQLAWDMALPPLGRQLALKVLKANPTNQSAALLAMRGEDRETVQEVLQILQPKDAPMARYVEAWVFTFSGQYEKAIEIYKQLEQKEQQNPDLLRRWAGAEEQAGHLAEALVLFQRVWELTGKQDPGLANNVAYLTLQLLPKDAPKVREAQELIDGAIKKAQESGLGVMVPMLRDTKGWACYLQGDYPAACRELSQAVKSLPASPEVHCHLGQALLAAGQKDQARWHLQTAVTLGEQLKARPVSMNLGQKQALETAQQTLATMGK